MLFPVRTLISERHRVSGGGRPPPTENVACGLPTPRCLAVDSQLHSECLQRPVGELSRPSRRASRLVGDCSMWLDAASDKAVEDHGRAA
jgi:hypothetical protein